MKRPELPPPYSDDGTPCAKCGYNLISTELKVGANIDPGHEMSVNLWVMVGDGEAPEPGPPMFRGLEYAADLIERKCLRCGHSFWEAPLDAAALGVQIAKDVMGR